MSDPHDRRRIAAAMNDRPEPASRQAEVSALARHADPSVPGREKGAAGAGRERARTVRARESRGGVEWVRAQDLLARAGMGLAGRGARGREAVSRRVLGGMASINPVSRRGAARRSAASLPPPTAFGTAPPVPGTGRGAVGR
ncbi:MAG: hypothetical protein LBO20_09475 [Bifidobacteriaceae bacterium]|jgi:hypothetical protein|nr:hypothetical protein [Bifidobacteriaceae bacterium]